MNIERLSATPSIERLAATFKNSDVAFTLSSGEGDLKSSISILFVYFTVTLLYNCEQILERQ